VAENSPNPAKTNKRLKNRYLNPDHISKMPDEDRKKPDELQILLYFDQKEQQEEKPQQSQKDLVRLFKMDAVYGTIFSVTPNQN